MSLLADEIRSVLDARFAAREKAIAGARRIIRASANGIRALHRGELGAASGLIAEAGGLLSEVTEVLEGHPETLHAGFVHDAAKEYAEARITEAFLKGGQAPTVAEVGVDAVAYLHGLGEAVGEMRRHMLGLLRDEKIADAERALESMDDIVDLLAGVDYPDGMTAALRRTTDVARSIVERSRSDLTATAVQERLREDLRDSLTRRVGPPAAVES